MLANLAGRLMVFPVIFELIVLNVSFTKITTQIDIRDLTSNATMTLFKVKLLLTQNICLLYTSDAADE